LNKILKGKPSYWRFNFPGKVSKKNWSIRMPVSLEEILKNPINFLIKRIIKESKRN
jgi:4-alpha-glucanotransferase